MTDMPEPPEPNKEYHADDYMVLTRELKDTREALEAHTEQLERIADALEHIANEGLPK